jgi:hypothetical protein
MILKELNGIFKDMLAIYLLVEKWYFLTEVGIIELELNL